MPAELAKLTYRCTESKLSALVDRAAAIWNEVLTDLVHLRPADPIEPSNIVIMFDVAHTVRNADNPTRVATCRRLGPDFWSIMLSNDTRWAISAWQRFWNQGENALAAIVHELGHVFSLPHAADPSHVMHPLIGGNGKLSRREKEQYRAKFLQILESEA